MRIGSVYIDYFTATDGTNVVLTRSYTFGTNDIVQIETLKTGSIGNAASKARVDAMQSQIDAMMARLNSSDF